MIRRRSLLLLLGLLSACPVRAVEPGEMLANPALEARARSISGGLRCLVCQNESIDESHAELAGDIRRLVRERLQAGDSDEAIRDYLVARYGQFILLKPPLQRQTILLWFTPVLVLGAGAIGIGIAKRRRAAHDPARPLSEAERIRLDELLADSSGLSGRVE